MTEKMWKVIYYHREILEVEKKKKEKTKNIPVQKSGQTGSHTSKRSQRISGHQKNFSKAGFRL